MAARDYATFMEAFQGGLANMQRIQSAQERNERADQRFKWQKKKFNAKQEQRRYERKQQQLQRDLTALVEAPEGATTEQLQRIERNAGVQFRDMLGEDYSRKLQILQGVAQGEINANSDEALGALNTALRPRIKRGIGEVVEGKGKIVDKRIRGVVPSDDGSGVMLDLDVQYAGEDGKTWWEDAPATTGRSATDQDIEQIPVKKLAGNLKGQMLLNRVANSKRVRPYLENLLLQNGGELPEVTEPEYGTVEVKEGDKVVTYQTKNGQITKEVASASRWEPNDQGQADYGLKEVKEGDQIVTYQTKNGRIGEKVASAPRDASQAKTEYGIATVKEGDQIVTYETVNGRVNEDKVLGTAPRFKDGGGEYDTVEVKKGNKIVTYLKNPDGTRGKKIAEANRWKPVDKGPDQSALNAVSRDLTKLFDGRIEDGKSVFGSDEKAKEKYRKANALAQRMVAEQGMLPGVAVNEAYKEITGQYPTKSEIEALSEAEQAVEARAAQNRESLLGLDMIPNPMQSSQDLYGAPSREAAIEQEAQRIRRASVPDPRGGGLADAGGGQSVPGGGQGNRIDDGAAEPSDEEMVADKQAAQYLKLAKDALAKGAPRDKVIARLKKMGLSDEQIANANL